MQQKSTTTSIIVNLEGSLEEWHTSHRVFVKEQAQEHSRLTRHSSMKVLPSAASIVSQSFGAPKAVCCVMTQTLQEANHKLKTNLRLSDNCHKHCKAHTIHGSGEGSRNSPVIWVFTRSTLFDCHNSPKAHGAQFHSIGNKHGVSVSIVGFVDNSAGCCGVSSPDTDIKQVFLSMSHDAQLWNNLLWQSGGDLESSKCLCHVSDHQFAPRGESVSCTTHFPNSRHLSHLTLMIAT